jgi:flavin-dependent dehydrogenase
MDYDFDIVIIGAATSGSYFAHLMAKKGYKVKVIEKLDRSKVGTRFDIVHMLKDDFGKFGLPMPKEGDKDYAFVFTGVQTLSPYNNYPKKTNETVVGMHLHEYTVRLNDMAIESGAEIEYNAEFTDFIYNDSGKICGVAYTTAEGAKSVTCRLAVDCSGVSAVGRTKLPAGYGVDNSPITDKDVFFVVLRYVLYSNPNDYLKGSKGWPSYKSWEAPQADPRGAILGIGASLSFEQAEAGFEDFQKSVPLPEYTLTRIEKGVTPYIQSLYSFVGDGFIASGDAACLTKPNNGEGITSAMVQMVIAAEVADKALKANDVSAKNLWDINVRYNRGQGADFALVRTTLIKTVKGASKEDFEYFFKKDIIFSEKMIGGLKIGLADMVLMGVRLIAGAVTGKISSKAIISLVSGLVLGVRLLNLYKKFPQNPDGFASWKTKADKLWNKVGKMSD